MDRLPVCFGFETALQISRALGIHECDWVRNSASVLSASSPNQKDIADALERTQDICPELQIRRPVHVVVGTTSRCQSSKDFALHSCTVALSRRSFYRISEGIYVSSPVLAFCQKATQGNDMISLLELGYELCGSYQTTRTSDVSAYQIKPLVSMRLLHDYVVKNPSLRGARKVMRALQYLADDSASPRETKQALMLGLPKMYGGYGLGIPRMNYEVPTNKPAHAITGKTVCAVIFAGPKRSLMLNTKAKKCIQVKKADLKIPEDQTRLVPWDGRW